MCYESRTSLRAPNRGALDRGYRRSPAIAARSAISPAGPAAEQPLGEVRQGIAVERAGDAADLFEREVEG